MYYIERLDPILKKLEVYLTFASNTKAAYVEGFIAGLQKSNNGITYRIVRV